MVIILQTCALSQEQKNDVIVLPSNCYPCHYHHFSMVALFFLCWDLRPSTNIQL